MKYFWLALVFCGICVSTQAQQTPTFDIHVHSTHKHFYDNNYPIEQVWALKEHDCPFTPPKEVEKTFGAVIRNSQSHLAGMIEGNVGLSVQKLIPIEYEILNAVRNYDVNIRNMLTACIGGFQLPFSMYEASNINYAHIMISHYRFLRQVEQQPYIYGGRQFNFKLIRNYNDLKACAESPNLHGSLLAFGGIHAFTQSVYLKKETLYTEDAKREILRNIKRFKGSLPLVDNTNEYMETPPIYAQLAWMFPNGLVGSINPSTFFQSTKHFGNIEKYDISITPLGFDVIRTLLDASEGKRILIDVTGMTVDARKTYYRYLNDYHYAHKRDTIPVLASNVPISGLYWEDAKYKPEATAPKSDDLLHNGHFALGYEDLEIIYETKGLIGLTLDKGYLLGNTKAKELEEKIVNGSLEYKTFATKLLVANMCRIIERLGDRAAWDLIAIGSGFDFNIPFSCYASADEFPSLRDALLIYFQNPTDLYGTYTAAQVKSFMYDYTAAELVDKIMGQNAYAFFAKQLKKRDQSGKNMSTTQGK